MSDDRLRDVRQRAEGAAYTAVGVGVLGFQQAQVRRRAAQARVAEVGRDARDQAATVTGDAWTTLESFGADLKGRVEPAVSRLGEQVDPWVTDLRSRVEPVLETIGVTVRRAIGVEPPSEPPTDPS